MNQEERDAEAKRRAARGGRRSQVVEGASVGAVAVEAPDGESRGPGTAAAAAPSIAAISQVERDAEAKNRARGARRSQAVGVISTPGAISEPVAVSEPTSVPGVQSVSGNDARALEDRVRRKERGAARANRRSQAIPEPAPQATPALLQDLPGRQV